MIDTLDRPKVSISPEGLNARRLRRRLEIQESVRNWWLRNPHIPGSVEMVASFSSYAEATRALLNAEAQC